MSEPYCYKTEFYAISKDGEAFGWEETLEEALAHVGVVRVDKVRHYSDDTETVWEVSEPDSKESK